MKSKLKLLTVAFGIGLTSTSSVTLANFNFPDPIAACVNEGMAQYCRATGQRSGCGVPTHIYYEIRSNCI